MTMTTVQALQSALKLAWEQATKAQSQAPPQADSAAAENPA
jgi:hypothetical protein